MKTLAFFSPKGGVGKTTHTEMFASYLRYGCGKRVCVIDSDISDYTVKKYRERELEFLEGPNSALSRFMERNPQPSAYDIIEFPVDIDVFDAKRESEYVEKIYDFLVAHERDYDYALFNFPGLYKQLSPSYGCIMGGCVDLTAVPIEKDTASRMQAYVVAMNAVHFGRRAFVFWNRLSRKDLNRTWYLNSSEKTFKDDGLEVHPFRVRDFAKASSDSDTKLFVRSTLCWPDRYVDMACPGLKGFYEDLKERLDSI